MARAKRIGKISNRDRTLYTLRDLGRKSFKREQFVMEARAHSEKAGEAWSKRGDANILSELDALLAEGVVVWDDDKKECRISDDAAAQFAQHGLDQTKSVSFRDTYTAAARLWRAVFPPNKRKTRLEYMWEYIRSRGKIETLFKQVAALLAEVAQNKATIAHLQRELAVAQQAERERAAVRALPTPGPSTPAAHAVEAYPTPRSEVDEDSPMLLSQTLPQTQRNVVPMTPVSNPRPAPLRRRILHAAGAPPSPSPLARQVSIHMAAMEADEGKDDDVDVDVEESMVVDKLEVSDLRDAEDSMVLDAAPEEDDDDDDNDGGDEDEDEELEDVDLDELEPIDGFDVVTSLTGSKGKGVFMRVSDVLGNFVGDIFTPGRARRSREPYMAEQEAQTLDAILPELSSQIPVRVDEAVDAAVGPTTADVAVSTDTPSYCSRAVSPFASGPDPREAEIAELRAQVAQLMGELESLHAVATQKDARIAELERQLAGKQRRLHILMDLHAKMDEEFALERAGH